MDRWIVHLRAVEGLLLGGKLETESSPFESKKLAFDWLIAALENNKGKCQAEGYVYGPGVRVELSPATDMWMRGARYGVITAVDASGMVRVRLDALPGSTPIRLRVSLLQKALS